MTINRENTEIISVHFTPKKVVITYAVYENDVLTNHKVEHIVKQKPVHSDFRKSIEALDVHLHGVFMCKENLIDLVSVSGIEMQSKNNNDSVKIFGRLHLESGNNTIIKTDFIRFDPDNQPYSYKEVKDIEVDTNLVREEAFRYLFEDKQAQLKMDFNESKEKEDTEEENESGDLDEKADVKF